MKERIGFLAIVVLVVVLVMVVGRCEGALEDCIDATCRISDGQGKPLGTGCAFRRAGERVFVLTNAHVVEGQSTVACEFWQQGHQSVPIAGTVAWKVRNPECDAAIVTLNESQFKGLLPTVIPLAPPDYLVRPGETLVSVGCARGAWATAWRGHAKGYVGTDLRFLPTPAGGRSGSAIFNADGSQIVALLFAREADDSEGMAVSLQALWKHLQATVGASTGTPADTARELCQATWGVPTPQEWKPAPGVCGGVFGECPGGAQCPSGQCPPSQKPNRQFQLFGKQEYQGSPYPSLPVPSPSIQPAPLVPISMPDGEARGRLDALEQRVKTLEKTSQEAAWDDESIAGVTEFEQDLTRKNAEEVAGLVDKVDKAAEELEEVTSGRHPILIGKVKELVGAAAGKYGIGGGLAGVAGLGIGGVVLYFLLRKLVKAVRKDVANYLEDREANPLFVQDPLGHIRRGVSGVRGRVRQRAENIPGMDFIIDKLERIEQRMEERFGREPEPTPTRKK